MNTTPGSLLEQLRRPDNQAAWEHFVRLYSPLLHFWAHDKLRMDEPDAADLVQEVFMVLVQKLPEFRYTPAKRFRGWLWTVTLNCFRARQRRQPPPAATADPETLLRAADPDVVDTVADKEYHDYVTRRALELMHAEFQATTWQAFWESVVNERSAAEVAKQLGLTENAVYLAKGRVLRRLRSELEGLLD